jgi:hypothetical protein
LLGGDPENVEMFLDAGEVAVAGGEGVIAEGGEGGGEVESREISLFASRHVCRSKRERKGVGLLRSK